MPKYQVVGTTSIHWDVEVEAASEDMAEEIARDLWFDRADWSYEDVEIDDVVEVEN